MNKAVAESGPTAQPRFGALMRARRRQMHMTLAELGEIAGLSVGFISQVERDQATPSLGALAGIARGLGVEIDYFIATPSHSSGITREGERPRFSLTGSTVAYERLHQEFQGRGLSAFILNIPVGHMSETVSHDGDELVFVLEGALTQTVDQETVVLEAGDCMHFRGSRAHSFANRGDKPARVLWTGTMPILRPRSDADTAG